jgi:hypothetical protein
MSLILTLKQQLWEITSTLHELRNPLQHSPYALSSPEVKALYSTRSTISSNLRKSISLSISSLNFDKIYGHVESP